MNKNIQLITILLFCLCTLSYSQSINTETKLNQNAIGYYQTINLDADSECKCNEKTQRTFDLAKGLKPNDVIKYDLHAYKFSFGPSTAPVSKIFKAFENDPSVYKVSVKEWESFMLLTTKDFNLSSFEDAALNVFGTFTPMKPEDFLKIKNSDSYYEYLQELERKRLSEQPSIQSTNSNH